MGACSEGEGPGEREAPADSARIEAFSVSRLLVAPGEPVEIAWEVENAAEVALYANDAKLETGGRLEGSVSHVIDEETRFRLEAGAGEGKSSREILVGVRAVDDSALILSFVADPLEIDAGEPTRLAWVTRNATQVEIFDEGGQAVPLGDAGADQGSVEIHPDGNAVYRLVAHGEEGSVERLASVKVRGQPEVETGISSTAIVPGEAVTLSWSVLDALRVVVREVEGAVLVDTELSLEGSVEVQPSRSTTYEIRGVGAWRDTIETVRVEVAPKILDFELVAEGPIGLGKLATLRWETAGASQLLLSNLEGAEETIGGFRVDEGSTRIAMGSGGQFRLTAIGGDGEEVEQTISGEVLGLPTVASFGVSPEVQSAQTRAVTATVSWAGIENAERVKLETDTLGRVGIFEAPFEDGSLDLFLTETTTFTLTVSNGAGEITRTATATVVPLPVIDVFTIFPAHAAVGEEVTLQWEVDRAASLAIEFAGEALPIDPQALTGSYAYTASEEGSFRLLAENSAGGTTEQGRALSIGPPEIRSFTLPKMVYQLGEPLEFSWSNQGGVQLTLLQDGNPVCQPAVSEIERGGCTIALSTPSRPEFTLRLVNGLGDTSERTLQPLVTNGPIIKEFASAGPILCQGEEMELSWTVSNDAAGNQPELELVDSEGNVYDLSGKNPNQGSVLVPFVGAGTHQYTLTATTPGTLEDFAGLYVESLDETVIVSVEVDPPVATPGDDVTISWEVHCADEVTAPIGPRDFFEVFDSPFVDLFGGNFEAMTSDCGTIWSPDDEGCHVLDFPAGFTFPFDGQDRTAIKLYANGVAGFDLARTGSSYSNATFPSPGESWANIAIFWRDLFMNSSETGFYRQLITEKGKEGLIIQWGQLTDGTKFQLVLWETGDFDFRYGPFNHSGTSSAVIGFQNTTATEWGALSQNASVPGGLGNRTWRYGHEAYPPSGSVTFQPTASQQITLRAVGLTEATQVVDVLVQ